MKKLQKNYKNIQISNFGKKCLFLIEYQNFKSQKLKLDFVNTMASNSIFYFGAFKETNNNFWTKFFFIVIIELEI